MNLPWFGGIFGNSNVRGSAYLPDIYPMPIENSVFVRTDVEAIYSKILTDVIERTSGIPEDDQKVLWDNCLQTDSSEGLVTRLAKAMTGKADLFLVYNPSTKVLRKADNTETTQIKKNYETAVDTQLEGGLIGLYVSFRHYHRTDLVKLYSALEYCTVSSLYKTLNLSKAVQYKINDLRSSVGLLDAEKAKAQAQEIADALSKGHDVYLDAKDIIEMLKPDLDATGKSIDFVESKRSFYLGLPRSYITGEAPKGLGDSGVGDAKAVERGLKNYFEPIVKPILEVLFPEADIEFKSDDMDKIEQALDALKTFDLVGNRFISNEQKALVISKLLDFDPDSSIAPDPNAEPPAPKVPLPAAGTVPAKAPAFVPA